MLVRCVIDHQVHQDMDIPLLRLPEELVHVLHRSESGINIIIIGYIVPLIHQRGAIYRGNPHNIDSQLLQVIQLIYNTSEISDSVSVRIIERLWINDVKYRSFQPFWYIHFYASIFLTK